MAKKQLKARITGRVQGVGFRMFTENVASRLGLKGYVKNLANGQVETVAEGDEAALREFREAIGNGPRMAQVTHVDDEWGEATGEYTGFRATG